MAQKNPLDLLKGTKVDLGVSLAEFNRKEYHHVFPRAFLANQGLSSQKINSVVNFCFLPSDSNKKISRKEPKNYFFNLIPQIDFKSILESNILPVDINIYKNNDYISFQEKRAEKIISILDDITN